MSDKIRLVYFILKSPHTEVNVITMSKNHTVMDIENILVQAGHLPHKSLYLFDVFAVDVDLAASTDPTDSQLTCFTTEELLKGAKMMIKWEPLSTYFPDDPPSRHLHIIFKPQGGKTISPYRVLSDGTKSPRTETVKNVYQKVLQHQLVQIRGTPSSGKSVLLDLLYDHILAVEPQASLKYLTGWSTGNLAEFQDIELSARHSRVFLLWDECQETYHSDVVWAGFKRAQQHDTQLYVVAACVYGSAGAAPNPKAGGTPLQLVPTAKVGLRPLPDNDDTLPAGLLLKPEELLEVVERATGVPSIDEPLMKMIWEWSDGYVGVVVAFLILLREYGRGLYHNRRTFTYDEFCERNLVGQLYENMIGHPFVHSLPPQDDLRDNVRIINIFRQLLRDGYIDKGDPSVDAKALNHCHKKAWIYEELDPLRLSGSVRTRFVFPFSFHQSWVSHWLGPPEEKIMYPTLYDFCVDVIKNFKSTRLSSPPRRVSATGTERPPGAVYRDEFYRGLFNVAKVQVSPEFASAKDDISGRVDFFIPSKKWGIELLRDGDQIQNHYDTTGAYGRWLQGNEMEDFIILDFRVEAVKKDHPGMPKLYHIRFTQDYGRFEVIDNNLQCKVAYNLQEM